MTVNTDQSWIHALQQGDERAAQQLFEQYFHRLVGLARKRLQAGPRVIAEPSDIAQSALNSFFQGARRDAFPRLNDHKDLWRLLVVITVRKALKTMRREKQIKRGGGNVGTESILEAINSDPNAIQQVVGDEPTPEMAATLAEELEQRLEILDDETLQTVARMKLEGHTNAEIAGSLDRAERTIERKLDVIRTIWEADND